MKENTAPVASPNAGRVGRAGQRIPWSLVRICGNARPTILQAAEYPFSSPLQAFRHLSFALLHITPYTLPRADRQLKCTATVRGFLETFKCGNYAIFPLPQKPCGTVHCRASYTA